MTEQKIKPVKPFVVLIPSVDPADPLYTVLSRDYRLLLAEDSRACASHCANNAVSLLIIGSDLGTEDPYTLCREIRANHPGLPILMLTSVGPNAIDRALNAGADECLSLPLHPVLLERRAHQLITQMPKHGPPDLTQSFDYLRTAIDSIEAAVFVMHRSNPQHFICNQQYINMWQLPPAILAQNATETLLHHLQGQITTPEIIPQIIQRLADHPEHSISDSVTTLSRNVIKFHIHPQYLNEQIIGHVWTLYDITKQHNDEKRLQRWVELEALKNSISTTFTNLHIDEIQTGIQHCLQVVGEFFDVGRCYLILFKEPRVFFEWCAEGVSARSQDWLECPFHELTLWYSIVKRLDTVQVESFEQIPESATRERGIFKAHGIQSMVLVPVTYKNRFWGVVGMDSVNRKRSWLSEELSLLSSMGDTFLNALERQRFEQVSNEQRLLTEALHDTATAINNSLELQDVFHTILTHVARVVPHDYADITLIEDGFSYVVHVDGAAPDGVGSIRFSIDDTPILRAMYETQNPLLVPNLAEYPGWRQILDGSMPRSYVGAPISLEGNIIGFINLINQHESFPPHYAERLRVFAVQVGRAIYNARIHEQVRNYATHLETAVEQRTKELARERAQLRATLDSMGEGVSVVMFDENSGHEVRYINPALYALLQYTPEEWAEQHTRKNISAWEKILFEGSKTLEHHPLWQTETTIQRQDGTPLDVAVIASRIDNEAGEQIGYVGIFRDISEEKTLQQRQARFVAQASHELRTPISNFKQRIFLIRRQPERMDEHLRVLDQTSDHIAYLVNDMMDLTRFQNGLMRFDFRTIHMQTLLRDVIEMQRPAIEEKEISLYTAITNQPLQVRADATRLIQVLTNLISNAINYSFNKGYIVITLEASGEEVILTVRDNGSGIKAEALTHIFQPFYRANSFISGTGLGLSIAKEIMDAHNGDISVESALGAGSAFTIRLPKAAK